MKTLFSSSSASVLEAIQHVVGPSSQAHPISLHEPYFHGTQAWAYVKDCIDTGWVSTAGSWVSRFEKELCIITGASHAEVVNNGTVALRLALHLVGVGHGDEVLMPPLSFVATANRCPLRRGPTFRGCREEFFRSVPYRFGCAFVCHR